MNLLLLQVIPQPLAPNIKGGKGGISPIMCLIIEGGRALMKEGRALVKGSPKQTSVREDHMLAKHGRCYQDAYAPERAEPPL